MKNIYLTLKLDICLKIVVLKFENGIYDTFAVIAFSAV